MFREEIIENLWDRGCVRQERELEDAIHRTHSGIVFIAALAEVKVFVLVSDTDVI